MTNLQVRMIAVLIYFPLLFLSAYDTQVFSLMMTFCLGVAWHEYLSLRGLPTETQAWVNHGLKIVLGMTPTCLLAFGYSISLGFAAVAFVFQCLVIISLMKHGNLKEVTEELGFQTLGLIYLTGLFSLLAVTQKMCGPEPIWFIFLVVGASDTGAYFVGRAIGKSPFFQNISPKKTLEGLMGGVASGVIVALLFRVVFGHFSFNVPSFTGCLVLGFFVSVISAFGDLFESMIKRSYGVKDAGKLIPGHGGILDRLDAMIFTAMPLFFYVIIRGGFR